MFSKYSFIVIIRGQLTTMKIYGTNYLDKWEFFLLFLAPVSSPIIQYALNLHLNKDTISTIVSATSIFAGLLLNLLVLLYSILTSVPKTETTFATQDEKVKDLIEHLFYNISFAVLICVLMVIAALLGLTEKGWWVLPSELVVYYLGAQLFLLVAQILKRFHTLLEHQISTSRQKREAIAEAVWGQLSTDDQKLKSVANDVQND